MTALSCGVLLLALGGAGAWRLTATAQSGPSVTGLPAVVMDAHRGGGGEEGLRENSISGARTLLEAGGVDVFDVDTRQLADGTPVLMHDDDLDRTTDHNGAVSDLTPATWREVRLDTGDAPPSPLRPSSSTWTRSAAGP